MTGPSYPAARLVSSAVRTHFEESVAAARSRGELELAPVADEARIEEIITIAFWASMRREEGRAPRISLAWVPPELAVSPLTFARRLPLAPGVLAKLAPAVERPGIHLGVWRDGGESYVWGTTRHLPAACLVLEVVEPGLLVVKRRGGAEGGKFANVAVLQGDQVRIVDEHGGDLPECLPFVARLLGFESRSWTDPANVLAQLAISMRAHGHGGSLLIVPDGSDAWRQSIVPPIPYPVAPPFDRLTSLLRRDPAGRSDGAWRETVRETVEEIAELTAVDGATVISDRYAVLAFGAKLRRSTSAEHVEQVILVEPVVGSRATTVEPSRLGGTRHLSAAQFVHDHRETIALVASQDGTFTVFAWPPDAEAVYAHRIEALLL